MTFNKVLFILSFFGSRMFSQTDSTKEWKTFPESFALLNFAYLYQGVNTFELGTRPFMYTNSNLQNVSLITNALFFKNNGSNYIAPEIKLRYYQPVISHYVGVAPSVSWWTFFLNGNRYNALTPELSITFIRIINISVGYNIPLSGNLPAPIENMRFGIRYCAF